MMLNWFFHFLYFQPDDVLGCLGNTIWETPATEPILALTEDTLTLLESDREMSDLDDIPDPPPKKPKWSEPPELTPQRLVIPRRSWRTLSYWTGQAWSLTRADLSSLTEPFLNDNLNLSKPLYLKDLGSTGSEVVYQLKDNVYEKFQVAPEPSPETQPQVTPKPTSSYQIHPQSTFDKEVEEKLHQIQTQMAEDEGIAVDSSALDQVEYLGAIKVLQKYSDVVSVTDTSTVKQMGYAVPSKPEKEFLTLNASAFGGYLDTMRKSLEKGKPTKQFPLFTCPTRQYAFSEPKPWQLKAPEEESDVKLIMDKAHNITAYYVVKKRFVDMESQLWAATGASSHIDHFLHGIDEALSKALKALDVVATTLNASEVMAPAVQHILDAQLMRRTAGRNNIHIAQTLLNGAANMQTIRRDTELQYHHRLLEEADITQLRSLPLGQAKLYGPVLFAKAKKVDNLKSCEAKDAMIEANKTIAAHPFPKAAKADPAKGNQGGQKGKASFTNAYGKLMSNNANNTKAGKSRGSSRGRRGKGGGRRGRYNGNKGQSKSQQQPAQPQPGK